MEPAWRSNPGQDNDMDKKVLDALEAVFALAAADPFLTGEDDDALAIVRDYLDSQTVQKAAGRASWDPGL